jgi:hypothetical protein
MTGQRLTKFSKKASKKGVVGQPLCCHLTVAATWLDKSLVPCFNYTELYVDD